MECRWRTEHDVEGSGIGRGKPGGVEMSDPVLQLERATECLLDGDLLVESEADQQCERVRDE